MHMATGHRMAGFSHCNCVLVALICKKLSTLTYQSHAHTT